MRSSELPKLPSFFFSCPKMSWNGSLIPVDTLCHNGCLFVSGVCAEVCASALVVIVFPVIWVGTVEHLGHSVLSLVSVTGGAQVADNTLSWLDSPPHSEQAGILRHRGT